MWGWVLVPLLFSAALAEQVQRQETLSIPRSGHARLAVENAIGRIVIKGSGEDRIAVLCLMSAPGKESSCKDAWDAKRAKDAAGKDLALLRRQIAKGRVIVDETEQEIRIRFERGGRDNVSWLKRLGGAFRCRRAEGIRADLDLSVPRDMDIDLELLSGEVDVTGMSGEVAVVLTSGEVYVERGAAAEVDVTRGHVEVGDITGPVRIDGVSGDFHLWRCRGPVAVDVTSGRLRGEDLSGTLVINGTSCDVRLRDIEGSLAYYASDGGLEVERFAGSLDMDTFRGGLSLAGSVPIGGHIRVVTGSGDVQLVLRELDDARLRLESQSGRIDAAGFAAARIQADETLWLGSLGDGKSVEIRLQTRSGDITLAKR